MGDSNFPQQFTPPPQPQYQQFNPVHTWGSAAMMIALIGSALTKRPLTTALNAGAQVMNAQKQNIDASNTQAYNTWKTNTDNAYDVWKTNTANAIQNHKYEMDFYSKIISDQTTDDKTKTTQMMEFARATKNDGLMQALATGGLQAGENYLNKYGSLGARLSDSSGDINSFQTEQNNWSNIQAKNPPPPPGSDAQTVSNYNSKMNKLKQNTFSDSINKGTMDPGDIPDPATGFSTNQMMADLQYELQSGQKPDFGGGKAAEAALHQYNLVKSNYLNNQGNADYSGDVSSIVDAIGTYRQAAPSGYVAYQPRSIAIMAAVMKKYPTYDATIFPAKNSAVKAFDTGKQGDIVRSIDTSSLHISTLMPLLDAMNNGDVRGVNNIANTWSQQFGGIAPTNFKAAKDIVGDEVTKAIVGGAGSLTDRETLQANFNEAASPEQLKGVVNTLQQLLSGQLVSLQQQFVSSTGLDEQAFQVKLLPQTRQMFLSNYGYDTSDAVNPASSSPAAPYPTSVPTPAGAPAAPAGSYPVPQAELGRPDGTLATINGKAYKKQGAYLVPTGS